MICHFMTNKAWWTTFFASALLVASSTASAQVTSKDASSKSTKPSKPPTLICADCEPDPPPPSPPPPAPTSTIMGNVDGIDGSMAVVGWACSSYRNDSIVVDFYAGGPYGTGTFVGTYNANLPSEPAVASVCSSTGTNYRYSIPLTTSIRQQYGGKAIYIHGISPVGGSNLTVSGSGNFSIPALPANAPPTVSLSSPTNGQTFTTGTVVTLSAGASDSDGGVARVEFYVDGAKVGESASAPYSFGWTSTTGSHGVYARAVDNAGAATNSATASITVNASANTPPTINLTSPANGQTFTTGNVVTLSAGASDSDGSVARVEFYVDGAKIGESTSAPYSFGWTSTAGSHGVYARAIDNVGAATNSGTVNITVTTANVPPTISLTGPTNGQTFTAGNVVTLSATASDSDGSVAGVEFYVDGAKVGQSTASPYTYGWTSTAGSHTVYAQAVDNSGSVTASTTVNITVNSATTPPPSESPTSTPLPPVPGSTSKTELITYYDDTTRWVLGQVASVTDVTTGTAIVQSATTYDPSTALPATTSVFGKVQSMFGYYGDGTLATVKDGRYNKTTFSDWYRGVPRTILFADGTSKSAAVNDSGWITSITDENGYLTGYSYDAMGRLSGITYPTGDAPTWANTTRSFVPVASAEYSLPAGHWRLTETTGNAVKITYYDGLWRPVLVNEYDAGNMANTQRFTAMAYDSEGRVSFTSYPSASSSPSTGVWMFYDALGRVTSVSQDSEQGVLTTITEYLPGFLVRVINPRGFQTVSSYLTYDQPTTDWPLVINAPDSATTTITRDVFGKPTSITRSGGGASATRSYSYNANQELCRSVEPETGATLYGYDGAGNLTGSASGLDASAACDAFGARGVGRSYDSRNRLQTLTFPDSNGNQTWTYTPDGLPNTVSTSNGGNTVSNGYSYNRRRLLTKETMVPDTVQTGWSIAYGYNNLGQITSEAQPGNVMVNYMVNALGQTTGITAQVDGAALTNIASNASYYPNGAVKQFTYGNGITHTMTQNARLLPSRSTDGSVLNMGITYGANGNVASVADDTASARQSRTLTYDGLDRLIGASSPMFGNAIYTYDTLDNLMRVQVSGGPKVRDYTYCYNTATNRLDFVRTGTNCGTSPATIALAYDVQGNVLAKNNANYAFDYGNRLRSTAGLTYRYDAEGRRVRQDTAGSQRKYSLYAKDGRLVWQQDEPANQRVSNIYLAGSLVAEISRPLLFGVATYAYQHTDPLGSPIAKTNANGTVIQTSEYEPYGLMLNRTNDDRAGYTGHVMDSASGLTYMQQRYYDPTIGRFLSTDPVAANANTGASFNRYVYASNNPYFFTDPDGRQDCHACDTFNNQYKKDAESGSTAVWKPFEKPAIALTAFMLVGPAAAELLLPEVGAAGAATTAGAASSTTGGLIAASEAAGGHMLARHVGLTTGQLATRLAADSGVKAASTFTNAATAESSLSGALAANQGQIASWLGANGGGRLVIQGISESPVGTVLVRGASAAAESSTGRFILQKAADMAQGFKVVTGYPVP